MPYKIDIEQEGRGVLITWQGPVEGREAIDANATIYEKDPDGRFEYQIWDYSQAETFNVSPEELRIIVMQDYAVSESNPEQIVAVVGSGTVLQGMDDLYRSLADAWTRFESRTFGTLDAARRWVDEHRGSA